MLEDLFFKYNKLDTKKKKEKVNQDVCAALPYSGYSGSTEAKIVHDSLVDAINVVHTQHGLDSAEVNHPKHYTSHPSGVECIQITEHFGFNLGNVIKYLWRAEEKGAPLQDLEKARWYLDREINKRKKDANKT